MNVLNSNTTRTGNFLVRSPHKCDHQPETFKCTGSRCKTCPFIQNATKILRPKQSININDRFTSIFTNVIYCIICLLCKISYLVEAGRKLAHRLREHLRNVNKNNKDASKLPPPERLYPQQDNLQFLPTPGKYRKL